MDPTIVNPQAEGIIPDSDQERELHIGVIIDKIIAEGMTVLEFVSAVTPMGESSLGDGRHSGINSAPAKTLDIIHRLHGHNMSVVDFFVNCMDRRYLQLWSYQRVFRGDSGNSSCAIREIFNGLRDQIYDAGNQFYLWRSLIQEEVRLLSSLLAQQSILTFF